MYFVIVGLLLVALPAGSVAIEQLRHSHEHLPILSSVGRWWTFWAVGIRLLLAGIRQVLQPRFTAVQIFEANDPASLPIVREVGFGNLAFGTLGCLSLLHTEWVVPAAIGGGLYYLLAGLGHAARQNKNATEWTAMISDFGVCLILAVFLFRMLS